MLRTVQRAIMKILILSFVVGALAVPQPRKAESTKECVYSAWGPWEQCKVDSGCGESRHDGVQSWSFPGKESSSWDQGRDAMTETMRKKKNEWKKPVEGAADFSGRHQCTNGKAGNIPCMNVDQLSFLSMNEGLGYEQLPNDQSNRGNDIWGWTDPITGDEYAIMCMTGGTSFVRITDPVNPFTVAFMYTETEPTTWRDIKTIGNYAYIGSEARDHGMQVFDMTRLRGVKSFISHAKPDVVYDKVGNTHNVVANEDTNFIYLVGAVDDGDGKYTPCAGGLHAVDVSNPLNPTFAGCYAEDGYTHDAQCVIYKGPDARYYGKEVCFAFNEDSLTIVDVSNKANMRMISKRLYEGSAYSHQGWLTEDMAALLLDDELDEQWFMGHEPYTKTYMWDIHNLENPVLMKVFTHPHTSIDHNQYIKGQFTYQANYESGLRIMYIDRQNWNLREVGHFDVRPDVTTAQFNGAWSVYPYFKSGTVVISSIDYGLFVVRPNYFEMEMEVSKRSIQSHQSRRRELHSSTGDVNCPLYESQPCSAKCD